MKAIQLFAALALVLTCGIVGCDPEEEILPVSKKTAAPVKKSTDKWKKTPLGKNISIETQGKKRRIAVDAYVCLREGPLELLMTRAKMKEHEAVLAADINVKLLHAGLLAIKAKPGAPVQFEPKYKPAHGQTIKVTLIYEKKGKLIQVPAQEWILNTTTKKPMDKEWVFGGSRLVQNPLDPKGKALFLAHQDGDVVCISNFESALLDVPVKVTKVNEELMYEARTAVIPKEETKVKVIFEAVPPKK